MKSKWLYFLIAGIAVAAVVYPVVYNQLNSAQLAASDNPFICTPLIPCSGPNPGSVVCPKVCRIYMTDSTFSPGTVNVTVGTTIIWINHDGFGHTSTAYNSSVWSSPPIGPGQEYSITIGSNYSPGQYYYHCSIHTAMIGLVNVIS